MKNFKIILPLLIFAGLAGCADSERQQASGEGTIRALNASATMPDIGFLLEESLAGGTPFKTATSSTAFDDLDYSVNFDYQIVGDTAITRLLSVPFTLVKDMDHLFIYTGTLANPESILWQRPLRVWDNTETVMQIEFGHLSPQLGEVDVYFGDPGTVPVTGESRATLTNGNHSSALELASGDYELTLTSSGDPADILFASTVFSYLQATSYLVTIFDTDPSLTSPISVRVIRESGASTELVNNNAPATLRAFHAAIGTEAFDLYRDSDFSAPLISNVANSTFSPEADAAPDEATYTFTPVGNIGATLHEDDFELSPGRRNTRFLVGEAGALSTVALVDDFRSLEDSTKLRVMQTAFNQQIVDIYVVQAGTDIADSSARFLSITYLSSSNYANFAADSYELYATTPGTKDVLAGPVAVDFVNGDVVHFALVDTVDPNVLALIEYDHRSVSP